ncbi:alpha/beta hydrolase [Sphingomonas pseudosanguinis]|uniref:Pimeloyl-ACP methyl ester carboxylesterase n=1 Tax=Sphingomonas pseudosanguinis TaxID=413712 RepID=A0A7W6F3K8_9SPHN|nr:alpha/beta hydrolase [Sphingomonas pseudosanguinis]MBB3879495.1 pimeloyl-ACP methyl ester carboxylesterase [Sphingomonas pseudosanguinis]MBN3538410.1 alpha/beta fold hydrolase [Sphingomonas pseudosanguinis]
MTQPSLVFLHALGASHREWDGVRADLSDIDGIALDLPGFGERKGEGYADVAAMADDLAGEIRRRRLTACILVGHSMGGKIATIVAARAAAGEVGLAGVVGVVLVAASPPCPEPMDEDRREQMIGWVADGAIGRADAETFVDANTATPLPEPLREKAIADVRRSSREAWLGWLERGSLEDWRARVGRVSIPALIVAGAEDGDLGEAAQRAHNLPHYPHAEVRSVEGAAHLIPYEQPQALARLIRAHVAAVASSALPAAFVAILGSDRVSRRTRTAMLERTRPVADAPAGWTAAERAIAAQLVAHILPEVEDMDGLAARVERAVNQGQGDGWRFAELPADAEAWTRGLATLDAVSGGFVALDHDAQANWLERIAEGQGGATDDERHLSPAQMVLWFQDVRAEIVRQWVALPATMAAIGYDGFAVGGDGPRKQGYSRTAATDVETWQQVRETMA